MLASVMGDHSVNPASGAVGQVWRPLMSCPAYEGVVARGPGVVETVVFDGAGQKQNVIQIMDRRVSPRPQPPRNDPTSTTCQNRGRYATVQASRARSDPLVGDARS
jgi:hypothetical protein